MGELQDLRLAVAHLFEQVACFALLAAGGAGVVGEPDQDGVPVAGELGVQGVDVAGNGLHRPAGR